MIRQLERERIEYALAAVRESEPVDVEAQYAAKYRTMLVTLPAMIRTCGLGQSLAHLQAEAADAAGEQRPPARLVYDQIAGWLTSRRGIYQPDGASLLEQVRSGGFERSAQATDEAQALLAWMTKFADVFLPRAEGGPAQ